MKYIQILSKQEIFFYLNPPLQREEKLCRPSPINRSRLVSNSSIIPNSPLLSFKHFAHSSDRESKSATSPVFPSSFDTCSVLQDLSLSLQSTRCKCLYRRNSKINRLTLERGPETLLFFYQKSTVTNHQNLPLTPHEKQCNNGQWQKKNH